MKIFKSLLLLLNHPLNKSKAKTILKLLYWKVNQLFIKQPSIVNLTPKVKCICYPDSSFGSLIFYTQLPDYIEMSFLMKIALNNSIIFDVGAGIGDYSLIAGSQNKKNQVFSFEPTHTSHLRFLENISLNNIKNINLDSRVISNNSNGVYFNHKEINEISHINTKGAGEKCQSISIDEFCEEKDINNIDLIKIDVEGAESFILEGMHKMIKNNSIQSIIIELNSNSLNYNSSNKKNYKFLSKYYNCYLIMKNKFVKITSVDGIENNKTFNLICINKNNRNIRL